MSKIWQIRGASSHTTLLRYLPRSPHNCLDYERISGAKREPEWSVLLVHENWKRRFAPEIIHKLGSYFLRPYSGEQWGFVSRGCWGDAWGCPMNLVELSTSRANRLPLSMICMAGVTKPSGICRGITGPLPPFMGFRGVVRMLRFLNFSKQPSNPLGILNNLPRFSMGPGLAP